MKATDLTPGLLVYYSRSETAWRDGTEDVGSCRWTVQPGRWTQTTQGRCVESPRGMFVMLTDPAGEKVCVQPQRIRGLYDQVAPTRRDLQERRVRQAAKSDRERQYMADMVRMYRKAIDNHDVDIRLDDDGSAHMPFRIFELLFVAYCRT